MTLPPDETLISFSDLKRLFIRVGTQLRKIVGIGVAFLFLLLAFREPRFLAEATFKKGASAQESGLQLKDLFQGMERHLQSETGTVALMQSKTVLRSCIEDLGMQIQPDPSFSFLRNLWENLLLELGFSLSDPDRFLFQNVSYTGERPLIFFIQVIREGSFEVLDENLKSLGKWRFNEQIDLPAWKGTLVRAPLGAVSNRPYRFKLLPWRGIVATASKRFRIEPFKSDRS
ncbi:MAG: hypothetical protein HYZ48_02585, partial [Chlamydiales bacterium]|nr:hypothetical protein [Chlamydiales bacterium]